MTKLMCNQDHLSFNDPKNLRTICDLFARFYQKYFNTVKKKYFKPYDRWLRIPYNYFIGWGQQGFPFFFKGTFENEIIAIIRLINLHRILRTADLESSPALLSFSLQSQNKISYGHFLESETD